MPIVNLGTYMKILLKKTSAFILGLCLAVFAGTKLYAETKVITLGGKAGWNAFQQQENIGIGKGRYGYDCIQLAQNTFAYDEFTDLLINFDNPSNPIADGQYELVSNNLKLASEKAGKNVSALSRNIGGLSIFGKKGTFFGSEGLMGSFSIEFWLCPSIAENGEVIINWESSKKQNRQLIYQYLNCSFNGGHLEWNLSHFFDSYTGEKGDGEVILKGQSNVIPDTWSYHALSYDCETGALEYYVNGITEDIKYITSNGYEDGETALVMLGVPSEVQFCTEYTGRIDDIRILRRPYCVPDYQSAEYAGKVGHVTYHPAGGRFVTRPIVVSTGSILNKIKAEVSEPDQTEVCFFVRSGDNYFNWTDSYPQWKPAENDELITGVSGMYFQLAAQLYPDGNGDKTPSITQIDLEFSELPLPLPPFIVKAQAGNGCVTLNWNYSVDETAGGYYIYYGNRPGEYLGRIALEGNSPVKVGNTTTYKLTGLENGKIYYFAVASWSVLDDRIIGPLSKEVYARPLERLE